MPYNTLCQSIRRFLSYIVHNTLCQSIRGFPRYIVHPGTVRGWPTAYIPTVRVSIDSQDTLYILGLSEHGQLHIYLYCQSIRGFPRYIVHPGTVRGWPTAYIPTVRVSADSQVTLYILGLSEDGHLHIYLLSEYPRIPKIHCTSWDCPRMANCIYIYCQSIHRFPSCIVHPGTVRGWPTAYTSTVRVSIDSQVTLYILGLSEDGHLHIYPLSEYPRIPKLHCTSWDCPRMATCIYTLCQSIRGFPSYIVHPGTVRGWPLAYIPSVRVSTDSQVTLYILGLSEDGQLHIYPLSEYPRIPK